MISPTYLCSMESCGREDLPPSDFIPRFRGRSSGRMLNEYKDLKSSGLRCAGYLESALSQGRFIQSVKF